MTTTAKTPKQVIETAKAAKCEFVDLKFTDMIGAWQHVTVPMWRLEEDSFKSGFGFDGSSIRGWRAINESDMLMVPDPETAFVDPFYTAPTLSLQCDIFDPISGESYDRDPRGVAKRAEAHLKSTGYADTVFMGAETEYFVFDGVRYQNEGHTAGFELISDEGLWASGDRNLQNGSLNLGYKVRKKEGYAPVPPIDTLINLRQEMCQLLAVLGIEVEVHHHEVASGGQQEISQKFDTLVRAADKTALLKYVVKNVARKHGKTATFMPKPIFGDNGTGMHVHQSLWKGATPLFAGDKYAGISEMALYYIGGLLKHGPALAAFIAPTANSYHRLVPGYEAPVRLAYSRRNRSAAARIPMYSHSPKAKRIEFRPPDCSANPYLAFAAMMMAGLDGIEKKLHPGEAMDKDIYELPPEELKNIPQMPGSLGEAIDHLEKDHEFLLKGGVFNPGLIETWIDYKRKREIDEFRLRPHPMEFQLYFDC